jgi:hypothetical protein
MAATVHSARISGLVQFTETCGERTTIPLGPCLLEKFGVDTAEIFWGPDGERSAVLSRDELVHAANRGDLVLLD